MTAFPDRVYNVRLMIIKMSKVIHLVSTANVQNDYYLHSKFSCCFLIEGMGSSSSTNIGYPSTNNSLTPSQTVPSASQQLMQYSQRSEFLLKCSSHHSIPYRTKVESSFSIFLVNRWTNELANKQHSSVHSRHEFSSERHILSWWVRH